MYGNIFLENLDLELSDNNDWHFFYNEIKNECNTDNEEEQKIENFNNNQNDIKGLQTSYKFTKNISEYPTSEGILCDEIKKPNNKQELGDNKYSNYFSHPEIDFGKSTSKDLRNNILVKRKRGRPGESGNHSKFSDDNLRRKCKHLVLSSLFSFINQKINALYNNNIGKGIFTKKLLTINQKQKSEASIEFNKEFLFKTIGDIFSENISSRYTNYPETHNKKVINYLKNDEKESNRNYFRALFNLRFLDTLKHFRGSEKIPLLKGLIGFDVIKDNYKEDPDYFESLDYYIMNFEEIINNKRGRKNRQNN